MSDRELCPFLKDWRCPRVRGVEPVDLQFCFACLMGKILAYLSRPKEAED